MDHLQPHRVPICPTAEPHILVCKGTWEDKVDEEDLLPPPQAETYFYSPLALKSLPSAWQEKAQDPPCHGLCLANVSVLERTVPPVNPLLGLLDAPQPAHFIPKLIYQVQHLFYLGIPPTGVLAAALRHQ